MYRMTSYTTTTTKSHSTRYKYATVQVHVVYRPRDIINTKANTKVNSQELPLLPSSRPRKSSDSKHGSKSERKQQQQKQSRDYEKVPSAPKPRYSSGPIMSYSRFFCSYSSSPPKPSHSSQSGPPRRKRSVRSSKPCEVETEKKKKKKKRCSSSTHQLRDTAPGVRFSPVVTVRTYR